MGDARGDPLSQQDSGRPDLSETDAAAIAEALGRLPLALSHAAAYLREPVRTHGASYLAAVTRRMNEAPADAEYPRAVFATFREAEEAEARGARAGPCISLAGFFAPDDLPEELFAQPPECYPPAPGRASGRSRRHGRCNRRSRASVAIDFHPDKRTFSVHRLVQAAARDALGETRLHGRRAR